MKEIKNCDCVFPDQHIKYRQSIKPNYNAYARWYSMLRRCYNHEDKDFIHYGSRGIRVCSQWMYDFNKYLDDVGFSDNGKTIDREDNNLNYCPHNIKRSTISEQNRNRRRFEKTKNGLPKGIYKTSCGTGYYSKIRTECKEVYVGFSKDIDFLTRKHREKYLEITGEEP